MINNNLGLSADWYQIVFENSEEGIWLIDENDSTIMVNAKLASILGYGPEEMKGRPIYDFMDPESHQAATDSVERRKIGVREQHEFLLKKKDGKLIWTLMASSPIKDKHGDYKGAMAFVSDLTKRKRNETLLTSQKKIFETLTMGGTLEEALSILIKSIESLVDGVSGSILLLKEDRQSIYTAAGPNLPGAFNLAFTNEKIGPKIGSCGTAIYRKEKVIVDDIANDPLWINYKELALSHGLKACWSNPIISFDGIPLGSFAMYFKKVRQPTEDELKLVDDYTIAARLCIEHIRSKNKEKKQQVAMKLLADTREALAKTLHFRDVLSTIPDFMVKGFCDACFINLIDENGHLEAMASQSIPELNEMMDIFKTTRPKTDARYGVSKAIFTKKPVIYSEVFQEIFKGEAQGSSDDVYFLQQMKKLNVNSYMAAPFIVRGKAVGGISVISSSNNKSFNSLDLDLLTQIASSCAMAIDNAILYEEATKSIKVRDDFISIASHELRTPLTSLKLRIDLLSRIFDKEDFSSDLKMKIRPIMSKVQPDINRFSSLIDTLLDISRLNSKRLHLSKKDCDISLLVRDEVNRFKPEFAALNTKLISDVELGVIANCDPTRLQQLVSNLLTNALKFGEKKTVEISLKKKGDSFLLIIKDHGIGISSEDQERIFKPFERAVSDKNFGGLGLGLYITLQIIKAHGGKVDVKSKIGEGTTFTIEIPLLSK